MTNTDDAYLSIGIQQISLEGAGEEVMNSSHSFDSEQPSDLECGCSTTVESQNWSINSIDNAMQAASMSPAPWSRKKRAARKKEVFRSVSPCAKKTRSQQARSSLSILRSYHSDISDLTFDPNHSEHSSVVKLAETKTTPAASKNFIVTLSRKHGQEPPSPPNFGCLPFSFFRRNKNK